MAKDCIHAKKIPKENWAIEQAGKKAFAKTQTGPPAQVHTQQGTASTAQDTESQTQSKSDESSLRPGWMHTQIADIAKSGVAFSQAHKHIKDWILLDSQSSVDFFCNEKLVNDIKPGDETLLLSTNAGTKRTNIKAQVPQWGEVWFDKDGIANIFSLASMMKRHRVTFDSQEEPAFLVHTPKGVIKFTMSDEGLFYYDPKYRTETCHVIAVDDNKKYYTVQQQ